jgi:hypothetical protein
MDHGSGASGDSGAYQSGVDRVAGGNVATARKRHVGLQSHQELGQELDRLFELL